MALRRKKTLTNKIISIHFHPDLTPSCSFHGYLGNCYVSGRIKSETKIYQHEEIAKGQLTTTLWVAEYGYYQQVAVVAACTYAQNVRYLHRTLEYKQKGYWGYRFSFPNKQHMGLCFFTLSRFLLNTKTAEHSQRKLLFDEQIPWNWYRKYFLFLVMLLEFLLLAIQS